MSEGKIVHETPVESADLRLDRSAHGGALCRGMIRREAPGHSGDPIALPLLEKMLAEARRPDLPFQHFRTGVEVHWFRESADGDGPSAAVLRYAPGASVPAHRHQGEENIYVISGAQQDDRGIYPAGTHVVNVPGSSHAVCQPRGVRVLVVWSPSQPLAGLTARPRRRHRQGWHAALELGSPPSGRATLIAQARASAARCRFSGRSIPKVPGAPRARPRGLPRLPAAPARGHGGRRRAAHRRAGRARAPTRWSPRPRRGRSTGRRARRVRLTQTLDRRRGRGARVAPAGDDRLRRRARGAGHAGRARPGRAVRRRRDDLLGLPARREAFARGSCRQRFGSLATGGRCSWSAAVRRRRARSTGRAGGSAARR